MKGVKSRNKDTQKEFKLNRWIQHEAKGIENKWYAIRRMDLLIISICSGGLFLSFEMFKFFYDKNFDMQLVKTGSFLYLLSILANFTSQFFGYRSNNLEAIYSTKVIKLIQSNKSIDDNEELMNLNCNIKLYDKIVSITNFTSILFMLGGITLFITFFFVF